MRDAEENSTKWLLLILLAVLAVAGLGFASQALWTIAAGLPVVWLVGFLVSGTDHRWYCGQNTK
jgi:hypothetical protein